MDPNAQPNMRLESVDRNAKHILKAQTLKFFLMKFRCESYKRDLHLRFQDAEFTTLAPKDLKNAELGTKKSTSSCFIN